MDEKPLVQNEEKMPPTYNDVMNSEVPGDSGNVIVGTNVNPPNEPFQNSLNCQVCRQLINLDHKLNNLVVKCNNCGEATPVKAAPPGKKYVRCTCNGLLICKSASTRVGCPRPHCRAIINLTQVNDPLAVATGVTSSIGLLALTLRVICACCGSTFIVNRNRNTTRLAAKCPHCRNISSIGPQYARFRWMLYLILGFLILCTGIIVTVVTIDIAMQHGGYYVVFVGLILSGITLLIRGAVYCFMPISVIESQPGSNNQA